MPTITAAAVPAVATVDFLTAYAAYAEDDHDCERIDPGTDSPCAYCRFMSSGQRTAIGGATVWRVPVTGPTARTALHEARRLATTALDRVPADQRPSLRAMRLRLDAALAALTATYRP